jgi:hypothetical protein
MGYPRASSKHTMLRRTLDSILKVAEWLAATLALWIPFCLLVALSSVYLWTAVDTLTAPGSPIRVKYKGQGDQVFELGAQSYSLDVGRQVAHLRGIRVLRPNGTLIASLDKLTVGYKSGAIQASASAGYVQVVRGKDLKFSLLEAFPSQKEGGEATPVELTLRGVEIAYRDESEAPVLTGLVFVESLDLASAKETVLFRGRVRLGTSGATPFDGTLLQGGLLTARLNLADGDYGWVVPHLPRWLAKADREVLGNLSVGSAKLGGIVTLVNSRDHGFQIEADPYVRAEGVRWNDVLSNASIRGRLRIRNEALLAEVMSIEPGRRVQFGGGLSWASGIRLKGTVSASVQSGRDVWVPLRNVLPRELGLSRTTFAGQVHLVGDRYDVRGKLNSDQVRYGSDAVRVNDAFAVFVNDGFSLNIPRGTYQGSQVRGQLEMRYGTGKLAGFAETTSSVSFASLGKRFGLDGLAGSGRISAEFGTGRSGNLAANIAVSGRGSYRPSGQRAYALGDIQGVFAYQGDTLRVRRLQAKGPEGILTAEGSIDLKRNRISMGLVGHQIPLGRHADDATGVGTFAGRLSGSTSNPTIQGKGQVLAVKYKEWSVPVMYGNVSFANNKLTLDDVLAEAGSGRLKGQGTVDVGSGKIAGTFELDQLQISDWISDKKIAGLLKAGKGTVYGSIDDPVLDYALEANSIDYGNLDFRDVVGHVQVRKDRVSVKGGKIRVGQGQATLEGEYKFDGSDSDLASTFSDLDLEKILDKDAPISVAGLLSGTASGQLREGKIKSALVNAGVKNLRFEGSSFGSGTVKASLVADEWTGGISLGDLTQYVVLDGARYNQSTGEIAGRLDALGLPLKEWFSLETLRKWKVPAEWVEAVSSMEGTITTSAEGSGTTKSPLITVKSLEVANLAVMGRKGGTITTRGMWSDEGLRVQSFLWNFENPTESSRGLVTSIRGRGLLGRDGTLAFEDIQVRDFETNWIHTLRPELAEVDAIVGATFDLSGMARNPVVRGSINATYLGGAEDPEAPGLPNLNIGVFTIRDQTARLEGDFILYEVGGTLEGTIPLAALTIDPNAPDMDIKVVANPRDLKEIARSATFLDEARSVGTLEGGLRIRGTVSGFEAEGNLALLNAVVASPGMETALKDVQMQAKWNGGQIFLTGSGLGTNGGRFVVDTSARIPNLFERELNLDSFLRDSSIRGSVSVYDLAIRENETDPKTRILAKIAPSKINLGGSFASPEISGDIHFADVDVQIPSAESEATTPDYAINPILKNLRLVLDNPAILRTGLVTLAANGGGTLGGSLAQPRANIGLVLTGGTLNLPTTFVVLEEGGRIDFRYESTLTGTSDARLLLNIVGRTSVVARTFSESPERYDVTLGITGDLLDPNGIRLDPTSDPPDLTKDQLLNILGQRDLIEQLAIGATRNRQNALTGAALSLAVPGVTGFFTNSVAKTFQLDYLNVDYNPFDGATFTAAKTLGRGLTMVLRRQLGESIDGQRKFDFKIQWRVPSNDRLLSRLRLGVGFDQRVPWKVTLDYFRRF